MREISGKNWQYGVGAGFNWRPCHTPLGRKENEILQLFCAKRGHFTAFFFIMCNMEKMKGLNQCDIRNCGQLGSGGMIDSIHSNYSSYQYRKNEMTQINIIKECGNVKVLRETKKRAALVADANGKVGWIKPAAYSKLEANGELPPAAAKSVAASDKTLEDLESGEKLTDKKLFVLVKFSNAYKISEKCLKVVDFQYTSALLPFSLIEDTGGNSHSSGFWVPEWWARKNKFSWKKKARRWI